MNNQIENIIRNRLNLFSISDWNIILTNSIRTFGEVIYSKKELRISKRIFSKLPKSMLLGTINHEIAHALVGAGNGHNHVWKEKMIELGETPNRCGEIGDAPKPPAKWHVIIKDTGEIIEKYYRKPKIDFSRAWLENRKEETYGKLALVPA